MTTLDPTQLPARSWLFTPATRPERFPNAAQNGADVLIFAGAPLAGLAHKVLDRLPVPIVDPVAAAVKQAELLVALASRKAACGGFARPAPKSSIGLPVPLADRMSHADAAS